MIVTAISELMNMRSFYNAPTVNGHEAVASKRTGVVIRRNHGQSKSGFAPAFTCCFIKSRVLSNDCIWVAKASPQVDTTRRVRRNPGNTSRLRCGAFASENLGHSSKPKRFRRVSLPQRGAFQGLVVRPRLRASSNHRYACGKTGDEYQDAVFAVRQRQSSRQENEKQARRLAEETLS